MLKAPFLLPLLCAAVTATGACAASGTNGTGVGAGDDSGTPADASMNPGSGDDAGIHDGGGSPTDGSHGDAGSGNPTEAGSSDATAPPGLEAGTGFSDGGIGGANAAIQDDFETGLLTQWTVTDPFGNALSSGATVAIDTTATGGQVHGGRYSVKIHNGGVIGVVPPSAAFYGRFWVWLATNPSPGRVSGGHWAWNMGSGAMPDGAATELRQGGQFDILIDNDSVNDDIVLSDPNLFNDTEGGVTPPVAQWVCVEFFYGKDSLRTWLQGSEITALDVTPTTVWAHAMTVAPWSPAYTTIRIGYAGYNGNPIDLWIDDVALDPSRVGCN